MFTTDFDQALDFFALDQFDTEATPEMYADLDAIIEEEEREREWVFADRAEALFDPDLF
jgi:hypothetical protein